MNLVIPIIISLFVLELPQGQDFNFGLDVSDSYGLGGNFKIGMSPYTTDGFDSGIDIIYPPCPPPPKE